MQLIVSSEELWSFLNHSEKIVYGCVCEWEGERVARAYIAPPIHAFGHSTRCMFFRPPLDLDTTHPPDDVEYFIGVYDDGSVKAMHKRGKTCEGVDSVTYIPQKIDLYSRSKGILEVDVLKDKRVVIIGLGSFGSHVAVEMAKSGVGRFSLWDFDRVELHNLMRHSCGINDLGRLKTDAIKDCILGKNPYASIDLFPCDITQNIERLAGEIDSSDLVICTTDNQKSRNLLARMLQKHPKECLYAFAITRAEGGAVFRQKPGGACFNCLVENGFIEPSSEEITNEESARRDGRVPAYASAEDANAVVQVGLSSDIEPLCNLLEKLALISLSHGRESGISCLESELTDNLYFWANRRERFFAGWGALPYPQGKPTILRWYGADVPKCDTCAICGNVIHGLGAGYEGAAKPISDIEFDLDL